MGNSTQTLQELLSERVSEFAASDRPREMIDAGIAKLFKEIVDEAFRSYGELGKGIKAAVAAALPSNISDSFELTRYNALIENALREQWLNSGIEADMLRRANEALTEAIEANEIPATVSLHALLESFVSDHKEQAIENRWEHPEVRFKESDCGDGIHIFFDPTPESDSAARTISRRERNDYELKYALHLNYGQTPKDAYRVGCVYAAKLDGDPIGKAFSIHTEWERQIAALYFGRAKLIVDCDADDFSYGLYD